MAIIVPETGAVATLVFNLAGLARDITWSFGIKEGDVSSPSLAAAAIASCFIEGVGPSDLGPYTVDRVSNKWTFTRVEVSLMTATGPLVGSASALGTGEGTQPPPPPNISFLLTKNTVLGGRKNRGRAYLPPVFPGDAEVNELGQIAATQLGQMNDEFGNAYNALVAVSIQPVLYHSDGSAGTDITSWTVGSLIATQRRRLRG